MPKRKREKPERISLDPEYQAYLRSTQWKQKRSRILAERGGKCEVCGESEKLSLHHLTYVRLYDELDSDLAVTCESCHAGFHGRWGVVGAIGAARHKERVKQRIVAWKEREYSRQFQRIKPSSAESNEWNGYDPFADANAPMSWAHSKRDTPSLRERFK